jgi:hypothetical protein
MLLHAAADICASDIRPHAASLLHQVDKSMMPYLKIFKSNAHACLCTVRERKEGP